MTISKGVLLVGSAKPQGTSTSESLARYLDARLEAAGVATEIVPVARGSAADPGGHLAARVAESDLFVIVSPLYVDSLPYLVTRTLESLADARRAHSEMRRCALAAIVNCGFPEAHQCRTAIDIVRAFARAARFEWAGALALGEGGAIGGHALEQSGGMTRHVRAALERAAAALATGEFIPEEAVQLMARPLMPRVAYTMIANARWRHQAGKNHVRLGARPFERR